MKINEIKKEFSKIYKNEANKVFRFCLFRISNYDQAVDITEETFSRFWQTLKKGVTIKNDRAFLFTIAHRLIIDWYRKKKTVSIDKGEIAEEKNVFDLISDESLFDMEIKAEARYILSKLKEISVSNRQAVYLRFVEGLSPPEIGEILDISTNAASVRINRGTQELKVLIGNK